MDLSFVMSDGDNRKKIANSKVGGYIKLTRNMCNYENNPKFSDANANFLPQSSSLWWSSQYEGIKIGF